MSFEVKPSFSDLKSTQAKPDTNRKKIEDNMENIYISKKQLSTLRIGLMSLTRDDSTFDFAIENGVFTEDDIHEYIATIGAMIDNIKGDNGVLLVTEIDTDSISDCVDLWGNTIDGSII